MTCEAIINCGTEGCTRYNDTVAAIEIEGDPDGPQADLLAESFGTSGDEGCDCPACGNPGFLADIVETGEKV